MTPPAESGAAPMPRLASEVGPPAPGRSWRPAAYRRVAGLALPALILVSWEVLARVGALPPNWIPAPTTVAQAVRSLAASGELWGHMGVTLLRVGAGFLLGAAAGTCLGVATGYFTPARALLDPLLQALRSIPSMAWAPLFLLWLGIGEPSKVALIAVGAFFPVYLNLASGIMAIDPKLVEVGQVFRFEGLALIRRVLLPATIPAYVVGLRSGLGLAWMFVVAAEIMGASRGLGFLMIDGQSSSRPELIIASVLLFAVLGKLTDFVLEALAARWLRWRRA